MNIHEFYRPISRIYITLFSVVAIPCFLPNTQACTLWGAVGDAALNHGTVISKNRDWEPDQRQYLKIVQPTNGHRYLGLFADGGTDAGIKAGVNDQGLAVITATAGSIPKKTRETSPKPPGVTRKILASFVSVDDVLAKKEIFAKAPSEFLIISDRTKIAVVEVGLDGTYAITTQENGTVAHTNHFCEATMTHFNDQLGESSLVRYKRIQELLAQKKPPYTLDDFKTMSVDRNAGPNNSIWRTGSSPKKPRTLATWIASIPHEGPSKLYVKIANPDSTPHEYNFDLNESFWNSPLPE